MAVVFSLRQEDLQRPSVHNEETLSTSDETDDTDEMRRRLGGFGSFLFPSQLNPGLVLPAREDAGLFLNAPMILKWFRKKLLKMVREVAVLRGCLLQRVLCRTAVTSCQLMAAVISLV